jgi:hypothetical protein
MIDEARAREELITLLDEMRARALMREARERVITLNLIFWTYVELITEVAIMRQHDAMIDRECS